MEEFYSTEIFLFPFSFFLEIILLEGEDFANFD